MEPSSASGYSNNFIGVGEAQFALKSVHVALWGGKIFSAKISANRPGLDANALGHEVRVWALLGAHRNMN